MIKIFKFNGYGFFIGKSLEECVDKAVEKNWSNTRSNNEFNL